MVAHIFTQTLPPAPPSLHYGKASYSPLLLTSFLSKQTQIKNKTFVMKALSRYVCGQHNIKLQQERLQNSCFAY